MSDDTLALEVDCPAVQALRNAEAEFTLLDVREPDERRLVAIEPSEFLPMSELAARVEELRPLAAQNIVVYCHHGVRSLRVARWLRQQGFSQAQSMAGGVDRWAVEIDPSLPRY